MIKVTVWSPDTCRCSFELSWDDSVSEENRTHFGTPVRKCDIHKQINDQDLYQEVLDENRSKNIAIGELVKSNPKLEGKENEVEWKFNQDRSIVLKTKFLTAKEKDDTVISNQSIKKAITLE